MLCGYLPGVLVATCILSTLRGRTPPPPPATLCVSVCDAQAGAAGGGCGGGARTQVAHVGLHSRTHLPFVGPNDARSIMVETFDYICLQWMKKAVFLSWSNSAWTERGGRVGERRDMVVWLHSRMKCGVFPAPLDSGDQCPCSRVIPG